MRIVVPIAGVVLVMTTIVGIALFNYTSNRKDALALSADILHSLDLQISTEVHAFFSPASDMIKIIDESLQESADWAERKTLGEPLAMHMLKAIPQLSAFSFADTKGNFMMLKKMPDKSINTKFIQREGASVDVTWIHRNPDGLEIRKEHSQQDSYDPRSRPWYIGAIDTSGVFWSDMYIFFTDQKPGITISKAFCNKKGEIVGVVGLDIELATLSQFLGTLEIGRNGHAMIIDETGRLVAFPEIQRMLREKNGKIVAVRLNEMNDPVLDRAYNRFLIEKSKYRELHVNDKKYINTISPLQTAGGKNWSIMIVVPVEDFVGFVSRNYHQALRMSIGVLIIASLLAGILIWQGLRADNKTSVLLSRRKEMEIQSQAFSDLAAKTTIFDPTDKNALEDLTRITANAVGVRRASVWQWSSDGQKLICSDCYDHEQGGHTYGTVLLREDFPQLFEMLGEDMPLAVEDTANNLSTAELHRIYLKPLGCNNLLSTPIVDEKKNRGVLWFEQEGTTHQWQQESLTFGRAVAGLLALRLSSAEDMTMSLTATGSQSGVSNRAQTINTDRANDTENYTENKRGEVLPVVHASPAMRQTSIVDLRREVFQKDIEKFIGSPDEGNTDLFEDVTVLVIQFIDSLALAEQVGKEHSMTVIHRLVQELEEHADNSGIEYMKLMGDQFVCAVGFGNDSNIDHTRIIADLALNVQDTCLHIHENSSNTLDFRIGIDTGAVIGSMVGKEHMYNLWGNAVTTGTMMAETGTIGEIHLSESTYRRLQSQYLFKARGQFYLPKVGELSTYMLTGRV